MKSRPQLIILALLTLFAAIGLVDSLLIHLKEIDSLTNPHAFDACALNSLLDCGVVARSSYAHFLGLPVSVLGMLFDMGVLTAGIFLLAGFKPTSRQLLIVSGMAVVALLFSLRLIYYSYFGLGVLCPYCLVSNISTLGIFITWFLFAKTERPKAQAKS